MTIWSDPDTDFVACAAGALPALVGTMTVRVEDAFTESIPPQTDGITEQPPSSGLYFVKLHAPSELGEQWVVWNDGTHDVQEQLFITPYAATRDQNPRVMAGSTLTVDSRGAATGLVGTIGVRLRDVIANADVIARTTLGITEPTPEHYFGSLAMPDDLPPGPYAAIWDDGSGLFAAEMITVATTALGLAGHIRVKVATDGDGDGFVVGEIVQFDADFYVRRVLAPAGDVTLTIRPPNGPEAAPDIAFGPTSHAVAQFRTVGPGWHDWRMESAGSLIAVQQGRFRVLASNV